MARNWYLIIGFSIILIATVALIVAAVFVLSNDTSFSLFAPEPPPKPAPAPPIRLQPAPEINIYKGGDAKKPTLIIVWKNLPGDTAKINIFRTGACAISDWEIWKIINVFGLQAGAVEIALKLSEARCDFSYRTETASQGGKTSWSSNPLLPEDVLPPDFAMPTSTPATVTDPPPPQPPNAPSTSPPSGTPSSTPQPGESSSTPSSTALSPQPTSTPSSTPSSPSPTSSTPEQNTYYTPQSTVSGYENPQSGQFWVQHVNQNIECGWQNLPSGTTAIVILRSAQPSGPWGSLIEQGNPDVVGPSVIRLVDDTLNTSQYYLLEAKSGGTVLQTFGPVLLAPIGS
jgi:hypothetical protein